MTGSTNGEINMHLRSIARRGVFTWLVAAVSAAAVVSMTAGPSFAQAKKRPPAAKKAQAKKKAPPVFKIGMNSAAFEPEATIPKEYTADGKNFSPAINWSVGPDKTKSFALVCEDPDASRKTWVHWV